MSVVRKFILPRLLFTKVAFLVGSGISIPSELPSGMAFSQEIAQWLSADRRETVRIARLLVLSDVDRGSSRIRFEQLIGIFRGTVDPQLKILDVFDRPAPPNSVHDLLVLASCKGAAVFTANFDSLIEMARQNRMRGPGSRRSGLAVACFNERQRQLPDYSFQELCACRTNVRFKLYGTISLSAKPTARGWGRTPSPIASIGATLDQIGMPGAHLRLEGYKYPALVRHIAGRTLVVPGYSGLDDFDVVPSLAESIHRVRHPVWIAHWNGRMRIERELGNVFRWEYNIALNPGNPFSHVHLRQWMYLQLRDTNHVQPGHHRKFGFTVGESAESFQSVSPIEH